jgi:hypothetical protein
MESVHFKVVRFPIQPTSLLKNTLKLCKKPIAIVNLFDGLLDILKLHNFKN